MRIKFEKENPMLPNIIVADNVIKKLKVPWEEGLIVKLLGKNIGYTMLKNKLHNL